VVEPGIDHRRFSPAPESRGAGPFRVCLIGRVEAAKGVHRLIRAWSRLALQDAELVIAGRIRPEMDRLRTAGLPANIRMPGILSFGDLEDLYRNSDLFAFLQ
jgi:glycosyltransferase involved in cell wall biosynthesis